MLRWRLLLGAVFIAIIVALCWLDHRLQPPGLVLLPLALILSILASSEILWLASGRSLQPSAIVVYGGNLLIVASNLIGVYFSELGTAASNVVNGTVLAVVVLLQVTLMRVRRE